jgi:hypothetical protein
MSTLFRSDNDVGHAHLTGQQDVLAGLRHRTVGRRHHQNRAVHLRRTGDHVLDVVGVAGAVDVGVVTVGRLIFHVRRGNRDTTSFFFRRVVDRIEAPERVLRIVLRQRLRNRRRQRRLPVVNMANGANIDVRFRSVKFLFCHASLEGFSSTIELHPQNHYPKNDLTTLPTSVLVVEGEGFEPSKAEPSDLQSDPVGHLGIPPAKNP